MTTNGPRTVSLRVRITPEELEQVKTLAAADRRTVSQLVWIAIQDFLRAKGTQP